MSFLYISFIKDRNIINIEAKGEILFAELIYKYLNKSGLKNPEEYNFIYNSLLIEFNSYKTLNELNIINGGQIVVVPKSSKVKVYFIKDGRNIFLEAKGNMTFSELIMNYCNKVRITNPDAYNFIYNSISLDPTSLKTLSELKINNGAKIDVAMKADSDPNSFIIYFIKNGNNIIIKAKEDMMLAELFLLYYQKLNLDETSFKNSAFIYNSRKLDPYSLITLKELNIRNGDKIKVIDSNSNKPIPPVNTSITNFIDICFMKEGKNIIIKAKGEMTFAELIFKYMKKVGLSESLLSTYNFIYNSKSISKDTMKTLDELNITNGAKIDVVIYNSQFGKTSIYKPINVFFRIEGKKLVVQTKEDITFSELTLKFCQLSGQNKPYEYLFYFNSYSISPDSHKTLKELNINNGTQIDVIFKNKINESNIPLTINGLIQIKGQKNMKFSDLINKIFNKETINEGNLSFIVNSTRISAHDTRTLKELKIDQNSKFEVLFGK